MTIAAVNATSNMTGADGVQSAWPTSVSCVQVRLLMPNESTPPVDSTPGMAARYLHGLQWSHGLSLAGLEMRSGLVDRLHPLILAVPSHIQSNWPRLQDSAWKRRPF